MFKLRKHVRESHPEIIPVPRANEDLVAAHNVVHWIGGFDHEHKEEDAPQES